MISKATVSLVFLISLSIALNTGAHEPSSSKKNFDGYQVLRIKIESEAQLGFLNNFNEDIDFWKEPEIGGWSDIMLSPSVFERINQDFRIRNINYIVLIPNVGKIINDQQQQLAIATRLDDVSNLTFWDQYRTLADINGWIDNLSVQYPQIISTQSIGNSYEDRPIRLLRVSTSGSNNSSRPAVFLDSGIHAREWISPATLTFILNQLITNTTYADILKYLDIYAVPVLNPDGYEFTHTTDRMWRKNRRPSGNCIGTDLNRNFPFQWCTVGGSNSSCAQTYCGAGPGSEPETQVIMNYLMTPSINWWGYVTLHSYGQEWCIPWAYTDTHAPDYDEMWAVGQKAVDALEAIEGTNFTLKIPSGRYGGFSMDWAKAIRKIKYSVLIELRDTGKYGFLLPAEEIIPSGQETLAAVVAYLREIIKEVSQEGNNGNTIKLTHVLLPAFFGFGLQLINMLWHNN